MPKRSQPSPSPSTPKAKRAKSGQSRLERYFSTSPIKPDTSRKSPGLLLDPPEQGPSGVHLSTGSVTHEIVDVDAFDLEESRHSSPIPAKPAPSKKMIGFHQSNEENLEYSSLSEDPILFDPAVKPWKSNRAPYSFLANMFATLSSTRSRISIINTLTNALHVIIVHDPPSLLPALYLLSNTLSPPYSPVELGLGASIITKAIQHVSGLSPAALKKLYNGTGDVGDVAFQAKTQIRTLIPHPPLFISGVYETLLNIARAKGQGATKQKQGLVEKLLVSAKGEETRYIVRTLSLNLRVGAVRTSILTALARAMVLVPGSADSLMHVSPGLIAKVKPLPENGRKGKNVDAAREDVLERFNAAESMLKKTFVQHPNYGDVVEGLLNGGLDDLEARVQLSIGIPLHPTLGSPARSLDEIYQRFGSIPFAAELKYDGQRAQIHGERCENGKIAVWVFSRHLEDMTSKYPDVVGLVEQLFDNSPSRRSFILDSEIVAVDPTTGELRTFQELANRARKDVDLADVKVSVCVFAFDIMYLDGEPLLDRPFRQRRNLLHTNFPIYTPTQGSLARFSHAESCEGEQGRGAIEAFWVKAVDSRTEGLMIKILDNGVVEDAIEPSKRQVVASARYEADKRTSAWSKLKKDYVTGIGDSLDLVPMGAWYGNGRKATWWSPILLGLRDEDGNIVAVCKCMSGFTDNFYKALKEKYALGPNSENCSKEPRWGGEFGGFKPEVYFRPEEVWEVRGADVTLSPVSLAALGNVSSSRGLSLRFPRFIRVRDDKTITEASSAQFLAQMWKNQQGKQDTEGADDGELIDVDLDDDLLEEEGEWEGD